MYLLVFIHKKLNIIFLWFLYIWNKAHVLSIQHEFHWLGIIGSVVFRWLILAVIIVLNSIWGRYWFYDYLLWIKLNSVTKWIIDLVFAINSQQFPMKCFVPMHVCIFFINLELIISTKANKYVWTGRFVWQWRVKCGISGSKD